MKSEGRDALERDGYWIARNILDQATIARIARLCEKVLKSTSENHRLQFRSQGSAVPIAEYPEFAELVGHPALTGLLSELELEGAVFSMGSLISKPPSGPPLFWHQDWWGWKEQLSYTNQIPQINIMVYLTPTTLHNGCLRVIPGSHRRRHPIHEMLASISPSMCRVEDPEHPMFQSCAEERAIQVQPGDIVAKDARLLHGAYTNASQDERTMLNLNYHPGYAGLPPAIRSRIRRIFMRVDELEGVEDAPELRMATWPEDQRKKIEHLFPVCADGAPPLELSFNPDLGSLQHAAD